MVLIALTISALGGGLVFTLSCLVAGGTSRTVTWGGRFRISSKCSSHWALCCASLVMALPFCLLFAYMDWHSFLTEFVLFCTVFSCYPVFLYLLSCHEWTAICHLFAVSLYKCQLLFCTCKCLYCRWQASIASRVQSSWCLQRCRATNSSMKLLLKKKQTICQVSVWSLSSFSIIIVNTSNVTNDETRLRGIPCHACSQPFLISWGEKPGKVVLVFWVNWKLSGKGSYIDPYLPLILSFWLAQSHWTSCPVCHADIIWSAWHSISANLICCVFDRKKAEHWLRH